MSYDKKKPRFNRRKVDPFLADKELVLDYKDPSLLRRFISDRGKIVPRRVSVLGPVFLF